MKDKFLEIYNSGILSDDLMEQLELIKDDCVHSLKNAQIFRTRTEMEISVLNDVKFPTHASKYWQVIREQSVMIEELVKLSFEYQRNQIRLQILERDIQKIDDELEKQLKFIDIDEMKFAIANQEMVAADRIREIINWNEIKLREADELSQNELENPNNHQLISYVRRWVKQMMTMGNSGSPSERNNLYGQLISGLQLCDSVGLLGETLAVFDPDVRKWAENELNAATGKIAPSQQIVPKGTRHRRK